MTVRHALRHALLWIATAAFYAVIFVPPLTACWNSNNHNVGTAKRNSR